MSIRSFAQAVELDSAFDSATQRYVYLEAAYWADRKGVLRISQADLADRLLVSRQTVSREFGRLLELGLLVLVRPGRYAVHFNSEAKVDTDKAGKVGVEPGIKTCFACKLEVVLADRNVFYTPQGKEIVYHKACRLDTGGT